VKLERTPSGVIIHSPLAYDARFWVRARGRHAAFRRRLVELTRLAPGESLLDVGSATGSLALAAKRRAGRSGHVHGVEPSPAMVAWARRKAALARLDVEFQVGTAQALPFAEGTFDIVTSTLVLHQLPHDTWRPALAEMRRVLRPAGRLLLVDIATAESHGGRPTPHSHGHFDLERLVPLVEAIGLAKVETGPLAFPLRRFDPLRYVLATV
jgi:ubiquinone/menaquinone biosynthesis C-methylase UbiE